jgi:tetratricopeptide (TPR) repeat protein
MALLVASAAGAAFPQTSQQTASQKTAQHKSAAAKPGTAAVDPVTAHMTAGADAMSADNYGRAAVDFQAAVALAPGNEQAQFWSGQALVYLGQARQAVAFLEAARKLGLDSVGLHLALVEAYAESGDTRQRDQERALLAKWHGEGKNPSIDRAEGFRLEVIAAGSRHINAFEYFGVNGVKRDRYRFTVRDGAQMIDAIYVLDSADGYQTEFAKHHPGEAAEGKRRYALVKYVGINPEAGTPVVYKYYNGEPGYDEVRADVLRAARALPPVTGKKP